MSKEIDCAKAWDKLRLINDMLCDQEFNSFGPCKECEYFYTTNSNGVNVGHCLKENIRDWTLYRMEGK